MDAGVLLLLVCCWKLTEESGEMGSDVTGETLTTATDFVIPTTSDQSTLQASFNNTNTATGSVLIQTVHVTTISTETEAALCVHSYEGGKTGMADFKETNTLRGFIEKERQGLYLLNKTINCLRKDAVDTVWNFIEGREERVEHLARNKTMQYEQALMEYVNKSKELNRFIDKHNSSAQDDLKVKDISNFEDKLRTFRNRKYQLDHLFTLINLYVKFGTLTGSVGKKWEEYGKRYDVSVLEDIARDLEEIIEVLKEHLRVAKALLNFTKLFNLKLAFRSNYTYHLVDLELWESQLQNQTLALNQYKKILKEEEFRLLLGKYINPITQSVIFVIGFLGNGILLVVFAMHRDMRTSPNLMVLNLAVGDFLSLISNILLYDMLDVAGGVWNYGVGLCRVYLFVRHLCLGVTVYSIVAISAQRFFALTAFFNWHGFGCRLTKKYKSLLIIASVWIMASAIAIPRIVNAGVYNNWCRGYGFEYSDDYYRLVNSTDLVALCLLPLAIIAIFSAVTARRIKDSIKNMPGELAGKQKTKEARLLSSNILITLAVVFAVCYVPYFLYAFLNAWLTLEMDNSTHQLISFFTFSLIFANSCFNPIAVYLVSRKYRTYMKKYLFCKCRELLDQERRKISTETSTTAVTRM
ncbi:hypothetical protein Cfor_05355 [Coptotermes formosanus]|uniref:G-protein coupled receptors family 1 profile domain-containing protein n=1 Tax=Coptotermes formosanus TaxID=36987 RepID=A0A6L2Q822_COPFO|nr:hypothetical protein Cfor_05355 [Coptotermes formosanus]